jgi:methylamine utilization protein MauJ
MPDRRFLLDFEVETHGCLTDEHEGINTAAFNGAVEIHVANLSVAPGTDRPLLSVQVIQPAENIEHAEEAGTANLKKYLQYLAFATNLPFRIHKLKRVIDWTLGLEQRDCHQFERFPGSELPYPVLKQAIFESIESLTSIATTPALDRALKWFTAGVGAEYTDDQFQYFWLVIELLAQIDKSADRVRDACPRCKGDLFCQTCNEHPAHRPYPKQAIRHLLDQTMNAGASEFFDLTNDIRNAIMHGEDIAAIEKHRSVELAAIVNTLGGIAWTALLNKFLRRPEDRERVKNLSLLETNMYVHQELTLKVHLLVYSSDPNNPNLAEMASPTISLIHHDEPEIN